MISISLDTPVTFRNLGDAMRLAAGKLQSVSQSYGELTARSSSAPRVVNRPVPTPVETTPQPLRLSGIVTGYTVQGSRRAARL